MKNKGFFARLVFIFLLNIALGSQETSACSFSEKSYAIGEDSIIHDVRGDTVMITFTESGKRNVSITISDASENRVVKKQIPVAQRSEIISLRNLRSGVYAVEVMVGNGLKKTFRVYVAEK